LKKFCPDLNENEARAFLIRSIHEADQLDEETETAPVSSHILVATPKEKVQVLLVTEDSSINQ